MRIARQTGWTAQFHTFPNCGRAAIYVLQPGTPEPAAATIAVPAQSGQVDALERELQAMRQSTSWRVTAPLRALGRLRR